MLPALGASSVLNRRERLSTWARCSGSSPATSLSDMVVPPIVENAQH